MKNSSFFIILICFFLTNCSNGLLNPCILPRNAETPEEVRMNVFTSDVRAYLTPQVRVGLPESAAIVVIINGNGYSRTNYSELAGFLASSGFISVIAQRPNGASVSPEEFVLGAINATIQELNLRMNTPVAIIGHSVGGSIAASAAIHNYENGNRLNIKSIIGLAPRFTSSYPLLRNSLNGNHVSSSLFIYGSQDEDVNGGPTGLNYPAEAFAGFDVTGDEGTTSCPYERCSSPAQPYLEKIMIYIHGAGHAGILNQPIRCLVGACDPSSAYVSLADQYCITSGYLNAYLKYILREQAFFKNIVYDRFRPIGFKNMTTSGNDYKGNPAGHPVQISFQISPNRKLVIQNFEGGNHNVSDQTPNTNFEVITNLSRSGSPHYVRHRTNYLLVRWISSRRGRESFGLNVPNHHQNTTYLSHLGFRVGQLANAPEPYRNPTNRHLNIEVCLQDATRVVCVNTVRYSSIPPSDPKPNGISHSAMNTIAIPLGAFKSIDRLNIRKVLFRFPSQSGGTILLDNVEWWRD